MIQRLAVSQMRGIGGVERHGRYTLSRCGTLRVVTCLYARDACERVRAGVPPRLFFRSRAFVHRARALPEQLTVVALEGGFEALLGTRLSPP